MNRKTFIQNTFLLSAGMMVSKFSFGANNYHFPTVRVTAKRRHFNSKIIESTIAEFQKNVTNQELGWLFNNCFPNTLDTTVYDESTNDQKLTYVITGDIDAMWLRDSSAQVWPYLHFMHRTENYKI